MKEIRIGTIYEDCAYHPVLCTKVEDVGYDKYLTGVSLFNGAERECSLRHCGPHRMTAEAIALRIKNRDRWLAAELIFRRGETPEYVSLIREENLELGLP